MSFEDFFRSNVTHLFSTPIYETVLTDEQLDDVQKELEEVYTQFVSQNKFQHNSKSPSHKLSDTTFTSNFLEEYAVRSFKRVLDYNLKHYFSDAGLNTRPFEYTIANSWMTLNEPGSYAVIHSHGDVDISGVYYFKTNGQDGNIFFETPTKTMKNSYCFRSYHNAYEVEPTVGKLLLFPGWLEHGVGTNQTNDDRVSISFNINFLR